MLLWLKSEGIAVDAWVWVAGVVIEWLDEVEVLAWLGGEAILAVEDKLEVGKGTDLNAGSELGGGAGEGNTILGPEDVGEASCGGGVGALCAWSAGVDVGGADVVGHDEVVGALEEAKIGGDVDVRAVGGEIPHGVVVGGGVVVGVGVAPDQLLHWVIVRETDQLGLGGGSYCRCDGVGASVLDLLNQVLVALLGEAAALLSVEVHVVAPDLEGVLEEVAEVTSQIEIQANLVVLESNQWQVQTWVAVEEEEEGDVHTNVGCANAGGADDADVGIADAGHLAPLDLVGVSKEDLSVQTPPCLVVLVNALATDGQLEVLNGTLGDPVVIGIGIV